MKSNPRGKRPFVHRVSAAMPGRIAGVTATAASAATGRARRARGSARARGRRATRGTTARRARRAAARASRRRIAGRSAASAATASAAAALRLGNRREVDVELLRLPDHVRIERRRGLDAEPAAAGAGPRGQVRELRAHLTQRVDELLGRAGIQADPQRRRS